MKFTQKYGRKEFINAKRDLPYETLEGLYNTEPNKIYKLNGLFKNDKGKFGRQYIAVTDDECVSLPRHMTPQCEEIMIDGESISLINNGAVGFQIYEYFSEEYSVKAYGVEWVDL